VLTAFLAIVSLVCVADAGTPPAKADPFTQYLEKHELPGPTAELNSLGAKPAAAFMRLANDEAAPTPIRARAMAALRNLPSPQVQAFVAKWVEIHAETVLPAERIVLRRAAMVLGWLGGPAMIDRLALLFDNDDADVRMDAVLALGLSRAPRAAGILRKRQDKEPEERIRQQIQRVLLSLDAPTEPPEGPPPRKTRPIRTEF